MDLDGEMYMRQERRGVLLGVYETPATPWAVGGTSWDYGETDLLAPDLDRLTGALEKGFTRFPILHAAGIRKIVNGPFTFTPDGNPLVGPGARRTELLGGLRSDGGFLPGRRCWSCARHLDDHRRAGRRCLRTRRRTFGDYASKAYVLEKAGEFYSRRFRIAYPNEYWPAGRPSKTSALHGRLTARNAVHGVSYGLEYPLYFAPSAEAPGGNPDASALQRIWSRRVRVPHGSEHSRRAPTRARSASTSSRAPAPKVRSIGSWRRSCRGLAASS